ncbi:hypothetical protein [uncultured Tateyamaria sp.]|uniref:hypothetical protein n=1 Tax=Tateyamaria sp. 1078 TaxID=3417464 RepID=UPI0026133BA0|nr:hypothetical protein [uncultured Tateyamaria sp.]
MTRSPLFLSALIALGLCVQATSSHAELSAAEAVQLEKLRGVPVVSLDGALVGTIDGASVNGDRASIFLRPSQGSLFRLRGKDVVIRTPTSEISLQANAIVLNSDAQRIKIKATKVKKDDDMIDIILPRR